MNIIKTIVIVSYFILGISLGILIIPDIAKDTNLVHTYPVSYTHLTLPTTPYV